MSVVTKILHAMDLNQYKLTSVITAMSVIEKLAAAQFFHSSGYWPHELVNGAFTEGALDQSLLEYLIDVRKSAVANPGGLLSAYLGKSEKFKGFCFAWLEEMATATSNPEAKDELYSFIASLERVEKRSSNSADAQHLLQAAKTACSRLSIIPSPRGSGRVEADDLWMILGEKTQKLHFVKELLRRETSGASASSSSAASPIHGARSGLPPFPQESPRSGLPPSVSNLVRRHPSSSSPRLTPRAMGAGVPSPGSKPQPQQLRGFEIEGMKLAVGHGGAMHGWVLDQEAKAFIGKLLDGTVIDGVAIAIFNGNRVVEDHFLNRIIPLTPEEIARLQRVGRDYIPYEKSSVRE